MTTHIPMRRLVLAGAAIAAGAVALAALPAAAQPAGVAPVPPEFLDETRRLEENRIVFCINAASVLADFDRAVAQAMTDALLLEAGFHDVETPFRTFPYDFRVRLAERDLFVEINNNCSALMGVRLVTVMPDWMTVSRPYYSTRAVMVATDPAITGLGALPAGARIGSVLGSPGDNLLTRYLAALPEAQRPGRVPYPDYALALERLQDGSVQAAFIWEPALWYASDGDPAAMGIVSVFEPPFAVPPVAFGVALLVEDTFTRGLIDTAIAALEESGALDALIAEHIPMP